MKSSNKIIFFFTFLLSQFSGFYFFTLLQKKINFLEDQLTLVEALLQQEISNSRHSLSVPSTQIENNDFLNIVNPYLPYIIAAAGLVIIWYFCSYSNADSSLPGGGSSLSSHNGIEPGSIINLEGGLVSGNATSSFLNVESVSNSSIGSDLSLVNLPSTVNVSSVLDGSNPGFKLFNRLFSLKVEGITIPMDGMKRLGIECGLTTEQVNALEPYLWTFLKAGNDIIEASSNQIC